MLELFITYFDVTRVVMPFLVRGFLETLRISFFAIVAGSLLGFVIGLIRSYRPPIITGLLGLYIHFLRGTPFLVQLYLFYFVLPSTNISWLSWDSHTAAFITLTCYTSSYVAEIVTGAIRSVAREQWEAAAAIALGRYQTMRRVILPQALRLIIQPMSGVYVILIKSTAIVSVVGIAELTRQGEQLIITFPNHLLYIYSLIAIIYFLYCYPVLRFAEWLEKRIGGVKIRTLD
ncbi:MAG TPA: amino acid ABC transporter permease [Burkholderiaceae bacterium]|nr:amino acid ABC transporter permease [Burkholderiaceae bacterium]